MKKIFIHGLGQTSADWEKVIENLSNTEPNRYRRVRHPLIMCSLRGGNNSRHQKINKKFLNLH